MDKAHKTANKQSRDQNNLPRRWSGYMVYVLYSLLVLAAVIAALAIASRWLNTNISDRVQFVTANLLNALIFAAIVAQVLIYRKQRDIMRQQWQAMDQSLERTDRVIENMKEQAGLMKTQADAALHAAEMATGQLVAMQHQEQAQFAALEETRKIVEQNERTIKATERSIEITQRQVELTALSDSAYLSVGDLEIPPIRNYKLVVNGKIFNRGQTPAFDLQRLIQIAIGEGTPPIGWGRFDWRFNSEECENLLLLKGESVNFTTGPLKIDDALLAEINEGKKTIVIDGQCRYRDSLGDLLVYVFGLTVEIDPPRGHIRYQEHRREKANPN